MREIVFDTETTGFEPSDEHRPCGFRVAKVAIKKTMRDA
jgi:DNA polymerase III epsilon subunit-like protein